MDQETTDPSWYDDSDQWYHSNYAEQDEISPTSEQPRSASGQTVEKENHIKILFSLYNMNMMTRWNTLTQW